jgi:hypothetical protein
MHRRLDSATSPSGGGRRRRARAAAVAVAALGLLAACGDDTSGGDDLPEAQPAPDVSTFTEGGFDDLPIPPRGDPIGERSEKDDVVAQSFGVRDLPPVAVLEFYDEVLTDWEKLDVEDVGTAGRADYRRDGRALRVTAQPAPAVGDGDPITQLSLQLGPEGAVFAE